MKKYLLVQFDKIVHYAYKPSYRAHISKVTPFDTKEEAEAAAVPDRYFYRSSETIDRCDHRSFHRDTRMSDIVEIEIDPTKDVNMMLYFYCEIKDNIPHGFCKIAFAFVAAEDFEENTSTELFDPMGPIIPLGKSQHLLTSHFNVTLNLFKDEDISHCRIANDVHYYNELPSGDKFSMGATVATFNACYVWDMIRIRPNDNWKIQFWPRNDLDEEISPIEP